ncbi:unnamed protein product [Enterobius vermicularis]|uniref:Uncharacterized protein n=1 Tax=Enterobius vermicularis TaxID=51028 RepID=A0A3P6JA85_ENTVE|nr:unnamed protein product [Enterobius vermicularis]
MPIAFGASLGWLEFGIIEYDTISLVFAPFLAVLQGLQIVQLQKYCKALTSDDPHTFILSFTGIKRDFNQKKIIKLLRKTVFLKTIKKERVFYDSFTAFGLLFPAVFSAVSTRPHFDAAWEPLDFLLTVMSLIFMANFKYSELWLQLNLNAGTFVVYEHMKYWLASIGQWFMQNMAHATIFSVAGKLLFLGSLVRYFSEKNNFLK